MTTFLGAAFCFTQSLCLVFYISFKILSFYAITTHETSAEEIRPAHPVKLETQSDLSVFI